MGNGIVYMQQIQVMIHNHIYHRTAQCRFVWRKVEKRIGGYLNLMIIYIGMEGVQTHRLLVCNKMYHMPLVCECFAQLSSQNTATPIRRITYYSYTHILLFDT